MARNTCLEAALAELAAAGVRDPVIARGAKHLQVRWVGPGGQARMVTVPSTASDWRAAENIRRGRAPDPTGRRHAGGGRAAAGARATTEPIGAARARASPAGPGVQPEVKIAA
jgi:hypothetical protein